MKFLMLFAIATALTTTSSTISASKSGQQHGSACASGLAKKGCLPSDQAEKRYDVGYRFNRGYKAWTPFNQIPQELRIRHSLNPGSRYIYDQNYIYRIDPVTLAVSQVLAAALG